MSNRNQMQLSISIILTVWHFTKSFLTLLLEEASQILVFLLKV